MMSTNGILKHESGFHFIVKVKRREQTERRMVKYGQVPVSRPCCRTSANVKMPGDKSLSLEMSFMFFQFTSLSDNAMPGKREVAYLVEITYFN
jgi:hypothetical protein